MNWPRYCRRRVSRCTDRCGRPSENRGEHVRQAALLPGPPDAGSEFKAAYEHGGVRSGLLLKRFGILGEVKLDSGIFVGREAGAASELHGLRYEQPVDDNDFVRRNACICGGGQELVHPLRGPFAPFLHGELGQTSHEPGQSCPAAAVEDPDLGAALLRWRPNQSLRRRRGRRQLDPSRRGEERRRGRWPTVLLSSATDGGLPLVLARFVRGLSTHQGSGCLRRLRTAATAAKCHRAPVDSHRVADQMPTGPSTSRRRAPHAASPLPRG